MSRTAKAAFMEPGTQDRASLTHLGAKNCVTGSCHLMQTAVVTRNAPDQRPHARESCPPIGWMCQCGERLTEDLDCLSCEKTYIKTEDGLKETSS